MASLRAGSAATELWYGEDGGTCYSSRHVETSWRLRAGKVEHISSSAPEQMGSRLAQTGPDGFLPGARLCSP
jgi:hypothetical protein